MINGQIELIENEKKIDEKKKLLITDSNIERLDESGQRVGRKSRKKGQSRFWFFFLIIPSTGLVRMSPSVENLDQCNKKNMIPFSCLFWWEKRAKDRELFLCEVLFRLFWSRYFCETKID